MRIVKTHTGKIYVDKDKKLEFLTVGDYGNDMDMCSSLVRSLLIKGESPTKRSIRKITEFTGMSADEVFYLPDVAA